MSWKPGECLLETNLHFVLKRRIRMMNKRWFKNETTLKLDYNKHTCYLPPVALENNDLDWMTNLKMYSKERKHFWIGSCLSVEVTRSAQWRTQLNNPLQCKRMIISIKTEKSVWNDIILGFYLPSSTVAEWKTYLCTNAAAKCPEM